MAAVPVLEIQEMLWRVYQSHGIAVGSGISAMPSLHVAIAMSVVLLARKIDRRLAIASTIFTVLIMIGSVHLGWHYAIDGYALGHRHRCSSGTASAGCSIAAPSPGCYGARPRPPG